jgi:hypothetical protein
MANKFKSGRKVRKAKIVRKKVKETQYHRLRSRTMAVPDVDYSGDDGQESKYSQIHRKQVEEEMMRVCISEGMTKHEIQTLMKISDAKYSLIEKRLIAEDGNTFLTKSSAHRYYEYMLRQEQNLRDLDFFVQSIHDEMQEWKENKRTNGFKGKGPQIHPAIVAIKAKSDILERTIKAGQDLGIINKRAKEIRVSGQLNLAALPTEQLRVELQRKLDDFHNLTRKGTLPPVYRKMLGGPISEKYIKGEGDRSKSDMETIITVSEESVEER